MVQTHPFTRRVPLHPTGDEFFAIPVSHQVRVGQCILPNRVPDELDFPDIAGGGFPDEYVKYI